VCTKYQEASKIVNLALTGLISQCIAGAKIIDLCQFGTTVLDSQAAQLYNKKVNGKFSVEKGVAFPVCISVNEVICNHSPLPTEELPALKVGDIVKIDLGCHIDGYIAVAAHTVVVSESAESSPEIESETGNVAVAAYNAMLVAVDTIRAGAKNTDVTKALERVAENYGVNTIATVRMHQMKRYVMDGVKEVALKEPTAEDIAEGEAAVPECSFEQGEVYAIDVAMTTGDGKVKPADKLRTTVFKRNVEGKYQLKMKASRYILKEVDKKFPTLPFTLRHFDDERQAKMGIAECVNHGLLMPYPSLIEKVEAKVAHFKCTVLLLPSGTVKVTGLPLPEYFKSEKEPDEETAKILQSIADAEAKKAKKKAAKKKKGKK
jgi:curved DNA binding protein